MTSSLVANSLATKRDSRAPLWDAELRGVVIAFAVMVLALVILSAIKGKLISYFDLSTISATALPLALAAMGEALVIICGGLDLSVGAIISVVNVLIVTRLGTTSLSPVSYAVTATLIGIGTGALVGAVNGFLVAFLRLQSIVVTLATMFVVQGIVLLILKTPGGEVPNDFSLVFVGDLIDGYLPGRSSLRLSPSLFGFISRTRGSVFPFMLSDRTPQPRRQTV
jgi:ribose transport system permease protein